MTTITMKGDRTDILRKVFAIGAVLSGKGSDPSGLWKAVSTVVGVAALADIHHAFEVKADGGTDEMGITWKDLNPKTKAYHRRFGPGEKKELLKQAGLGGLRFKRKKVTPFDAVDGGGCPDRPKYTVLQRGLLTKSQNERWKKIFREQYTRFCLSLPAEAAKGRAAQIAWHVVKNEGGRTMLEVFGNRKVQILRDTGRLLNSLGPGEINGEQYRKPNGDGGDEQVWKAGPGFVTVGTNVAYAATHNFGDAKRGIPRRQFLPDDGQPIPVAWRDNWNDAASQAIIVGFHHYMTKG